MFVQEYNGAKGLTSTTLRGAGRLSAWVLGRCGDMALLGQVSQKSFDLRGAHVFGMAFVVKQDVTLDPIDIGLFGAIGIMLCAQSFADTFDKLSASLVEQFGGLCFHFTLKG
jgi:hypothetical protein